jgi:uncharacterized protein YndB with AHSA1/START domain
MSQQVLSLSRRFDVPPARLFRAWTDPDIAQAWLFTTAESEAHETLMDVRAGGAWSITDRRGGVAYEAIGRFLVVEPPKRLVFSFGMPQFSPAFNRVTVELTPDDEGTILTLTQEGMPPEQILPAEDGWARMFDALAQRLSLQQV